MAKVPKTFVDETLWPEFTALNEALEEHLDEITAAIIAKAVFADSSDDITEVAAIQA